MTTQIAEPLIVGVDGSAASDDALAFACSEAAARGLALALLHAWQPFPAYASSSMWSPGPMTPTSGEVERAARSVLDRAAARVAGHAPRLMHAEYLVQQSPASALIDASEDALLVVVGGRDRAQHEPGWVGPVPVRLAARAHCPVVVVPSAPTLLGPVVVGVDGSATSELAVAFAFEQAARSGVALHAVLAFAPMTQPTGLDTNLTPDMPENALRQLSEGLAGWAEKFPDVQVQKSVTSEPVLRELRRASQQASLLVVGSHGRGFFLRHTLGSVSSALIRVSDCPVAVVGHKP